MFIPIFKQATGMCSFVVLTVGQTSHKLKKKKKNTINVLKKKEEFLYNTRHANTVCTEGVAHSFKNKTIQKRICNTLIYIHTYKKGREGKGGGKKKPLSKAQVQKISLPGPQFNHRCKRRLIYLIRHITQHIRS